MKVYELIAKLQELIQDADLYVDLDKEDIRKIMDITFDSNPANAYEISMDITT